MSVHQNLYHIVYNLTPNIVCLQLWFVSHAWRKVVCLLSVKSNIWLWYKTDVYFSEKQLLLRTENLISWFGSVVSWFILCSTWCCYVNLVVYEHGVTIKTNRHYTTMEILFFRLFIFNTKRHIIAHLMKYIIKSTCG